MHREVSAADTRLWVVRGGGWRAGPNTRHKDVDIVVIRENTEGEYSGMEHEVAPGIAESLKVSCWVGCGVVVARRALLHPHTQNIARNERDCCGLPLFVFDDFVLRASPSLFANAWSGRSSLCHFWG